MRVLQRMRSSASSVNFQCLLISLRSSSSCLSLLPRLPATSIFPSIHTFEFLGSLQWCVFPPHTLIFVCTFRLPWMMEHADPHLMSNLSAVSLTTISLYLITRKLTCSALPAFCEVVRGLNQSSSLTLVLPLWNLSTY